MAVVVVMPKQGQSVESCIITEIFKKKGDAVKKAISCLLTKPIRHRSKKNPLLMVWFWNVSITMATKCWYWKI